MLAGRAGASLPMGRGPVQGRAALIRDSCPANAGQRTSDSWAAARWGSCAKVGSYDRLRALLSHPSSPQVLARSVGPITTGMCQRV